MHRRLAAFLFLLLCAGCSKNEQPPAIVQQEKQQAPQAADGNALPKAPVAAQPAPELQATAMRGAPSAKPIPAPAQKAAPPLARPVGEPMLGASIPVRDRDGIERIALLPGAPAPQPIEPRRVVAEPAPAPPVAAPVVAAAPAPQPVPGREVVLTPNTTAAPAIFHSPTAQPLPTKPVLPPARVVDAAKPAPQPIVSHATKRPITTMNELIIDCIRTFPAGGSYQADAAAIELLKTAVTVSGNRITVMPDLARPSFCSSATYLVFLTAMDRLHQGNRIRLTDDAMAALLIQGQPDGDGVWGRWNANGPGTARLFHELGLGRSFTNPIAAKPGDFLKIWWTDEIGSLERGHSVIFLGIGKTEKGEMGVRYWSSNKPGGFGEAVAPMSTVKRMLFSRLDNPRALVNAALIPQTDQYLADMLKRPGTEEEMFRMCGVQ